MIRFNEREKARKAVDSTVVPVISDLVNERLETKNGRMMVPDRPGLGVTLSDQARAWTTESVEFGA